MKKILLTVVALICQTAFCQKENPLAKDELLAKTVEKLHSVCKLIYIANNGDVEKIKSLTSKVESINVEMNREEYNNELIKTLNLKEGYDLVSELNQIHENILELKNKYKDEFTTENIASGADIYKALEIGGSLDGATGYPCAHPWSNAICQGAVVAATITALSGCELITAGLGTAACVAGAILAETEGLNQCYKSWCLE